METTPQILVVGPDPLLRSEFGAASEGLRRWRPVVHFEPDLRKGVESARARRPDLVCLQVDGAPSLRTFAEDVRRSAPGTAVVALYRPDGLGFGRSESSFFIEAMRAEVQDFLRRPLAAEELQQLLDRLFGKPRDHGRDLGRVVSIVSNKGGVGKSTISVNMAAALAKRHPDRVLLVDVSLHLGSCAPMLDLEPPTNLATVARECERLDETLLRKLAVRHECGLHVLAAPIDAVEASEIDDENLSRILAIARRTYDWVIVDTFPMLDGLVMAILDLSDRAYVIVQNAVPNVHGAAHYLPVIGHIGFPRERVRVVLNNNFQRCSGTLRTKDVEERLGREVHHVIPYQKKLITALNTGRPYALNSGSMFGFGKAIRRIVLELEGLREESAATAIRGIAEATEVVELDAVMPGAVPVEPADGRVEERVSA